MLKVSIMKLLNLLIIIKVKKILNNKFLVSLVYKSLEILIQKVYIRIPFYQNIFFFKLNFRKLINHIYQAKYFY